jgi:prevent-host-death family protein
MVKVQIHELKAKLSHYLKLVQNGTTVIILKRNIEIGEITPSKPKEGKRELGLARKHYPGFKWEFEWFRHNRRSMIIWMDGHSSTIPYSKTGYDYRWYTGEAPLQAAP